uniref:Uncharacterized protein n=1 Tax=Aegilops tauschii subsp. strangulata TaxID=200361 RepID=A0A452YQ98_AEGTS
MYISTDLSQMSYKRFRMVDSFPQCRSSPSDVKLGRIDQYDGV